MNAAAFGCVQAFGIKVYSRSNVMRGRVIGCTAEAPGFAVASKALFRLHGGVLRVKSRMAYAVTFHVTPSSRPGAGSLVVLTRGDFKGARADC